MYGLVALGIFIVGVVIYCSIAWYRVVSPSEAHLVVAPTKKLVVSPDPNIRKGTDKNTYFAIPKWLPGFGRSVRVMDVTIKEILIDQETVEEKQARYNVTSSTKYRVVNVETAAETFTNDEELKQMLKEVIQASVRTVTIKYDVVNARAKKKEIAEKIREEMKDDLDSWGLRLINFQLVDFKDTETSTVISDISKRREVEISSRTREENAEKKKSARIKEAEAEELAKSSEILKDEVIGKKDQNKAQAISEQEKLAEEKNFEVLQVQTIKQAEIDKEKAIIKADEEKETEEIKKDQKELEGEGDRLKLEQQAIGNAAKTREDGLAEAEALTAKQKALSLFDDKAVRALIAEKLVGMQKEVGIAGAAAIGNADTKVFIGSDGGGGFDIGKMIAATSVSNEATAGSVLNRLARPNDFGFKSLGELMTALEATKKKPKGKGKKVVDVEPDVVDKVFDGSFKERP